MERFPVGRDDRERVVFSNLSTAYQAPLVLPKWSNQISASSINVPLFKKQTNNNKKKNIAATITETDESSVEQTPCVDLKYGASMQP